MDNKGKKVSTPTFGGFKAVTGMPEIEVPEGEQSIEEVNLESGDKTIVSEEVEDLTIDKPKKVAKPKEISNPIENETAGEETTDGEGEENTENSENENDEPSLFKIFTKDLYEKGVLDFNHEDPDFEESDKGLEKLVDKTVQNRIDKWTNNLDPEFVKFLEFVQSGGTPKQFLDVYYGNHSWESFKIDDENAQKFAVKESLRLAGESEEDIEDIVTEWYDNGSLEKRAKSALVKLQKAEQSKKEELVEIQKNYAEQQKAAEKKYWDDFKKELYSKDKIMGFRVSDKTKDKLWDFITVPDKKTGKTAYQTAVEQNVESSLLFALQAMNGFDINKLEKEVSTKVASQLGSVLKNYSGNKKDSKDKISSGSNSQFEGDNPFKAFSQI